MIKAEFLRNNKDQIYSVTIEGHADSGPYGQDIVCASISTISIGTINNLNRLAGIDPKVEMDDENGGYIKIDLDYSKYDENQTNKASLLMDNFYYVCKDVAESYSEFVSLV